MAVAVRAAQGSRRAAAADNLRRYHRDEGMRIVRLRFGIFAVVVAAAMIMPGTASAASKPVITSYVAMAGVPTHVAAGGMLAFTETYVEKSSYDAELELLSVELWNTCLCSKDRTDGTVASYLDPASHTWKTSPRAEGDSYSLDIHMRVKPNQTVSVPVRIKLAGWPSGTYKLSVDGVVVGNVVADDGTYDFDFKFHSAADRSFTVGGTTSKPKPTPTPATHSTSPAHSAPKPTPTSSPASTVSSAPAAVATPEQLSSAIPGLGTPPATLAAAEVATSGVGGIAVVGAGLVVVAALLGGGYYWRRRRLD